MGHPTIMQVMSHIIHQHCVHPLKFVSPTLQKLQYPAVSPVCKKLIGMLRIRLETGDGRLGGALRPDRNEKISSISPNG